MYGSSDISVTDEWMKTDGWMDGEVKYSGRCPALLFIKNIWTL